MKSHLLPLLLLPLLPSTLASAPTNPGPKWIKTLFLDDFTGGKGAPPLSSNWILQTGTSYPGGPPQWGTWEVETYTSSSANVGQSGTGNLLITPIKNPSTNQWTSARIETVQQNFLCPEGGRLRIEASISLPDVSGDAAAGYWPAFWALGEGFRKNVTAWPGVGEVDIMESVNGRNVTSQALHCGSAPGGPCNEYTGLTNFPAGSGCVGSSCTGSFHTYRFIVDRTVTPETMTWSIDNVQKFQVTQTQLGKAVWNQTVYHGFFVILNVAMGGNLPNYQANMTTPTAKTVSGKSMAVDYVAVWATK